MDALLLALLLGVALDQGDRSQRLARAMTASAILPLCLIVATTSVIASLLGLAVTPILQGKSGLLFFAFALLLGGAGLILPSGKALVKSGTTQRALLARLALLRLTDRTSFILIGIAAMTGNSWGTAIGGTLAGLAALLPPLLWAGAYERALPWRIIRPALGFMLLPASMLCVVSALGLL